MASQSVANSTELRDAIQQALPADTITLTSTSTAHFYSVTTLAKLVCNTSTAVAGSGYVITGGNTSGIIVRNTRIFQKNIDGPYAPGAVTMSSSNMTLNYTTGGAADASSLFDATSGTFTLNRLNFTGTHRGWDGNGGLYMSMRAFGSATANTTFTLSNSTVAITGQGQGTNYSFDPTSTATNAGGSAFLHSWNNTGTVTLNTVIFNESGYLSSFNYGNDSATPKGTYNITGSTFGRATASARVVRYEGNRLTNANATLTTNTFKEGSYLDLYGNTGSVKFAGTNQFTTIAGGYGVRVTALAGVTTSNPVLSDNATINFTGPGLAFSYINAAAGTVRLDTVGGSNSRSITVGGTSYQELIAGGQASDTISASGTTTGAWINADAGNDTVTGSNGNDSIMGGTGNDSISAGLGSDVIDAGDGNDTVFGGNGSDSIVGGIGDDYLDGGEGIDTISGGNGNDTLVGNTGDDLLTGGAGSDMFEWFTGDSTDTITDFTSGAGNDQFALPSIFANTTSGSTLNAADFTTETTLAALAAADDLKVVKITDGQTSAEITADGVYAAVDAYVLVFNTDTNFAQLWFDDNWSDNSGERTQLATFSNVTSASGLSGFVNSNFFANA